jgi:hypothetical protein
LNALLLICGGLEKRLSSRVFFCLVVGGVSGGARALVVAAAADGAAGYAATSGDECALAQLFDG